MDEINKRIIDWMVKSGHSKSTFARELGVSLPLITHITSGRNKPGLDLIQKLLTVFKELNPDWLLNGEGNMYREKSEAIDLSNELAQLNNLKSLVNKSLDQYASVKSYHRIIMDEILHLQELDLQMESANVDLIKLKKDLETQLQSIRIKLKDE